MDRWTWSDPRVVARVAEQANAIQVDVDAEPEIAKRLKAKWEPSSVAIERGVEIDRVVGFQQADKILAWLEGLSRGETWVEGLRREADANPKRVDLRMDLAGGLMHAEQFDEAISEHVWLWKHMVEHMPQLAGMKHSFFVDRLKHLFSVHPPAREPFVAIRDASLPNVDEPDATTFADWCALNQALGESAKTIAWFDEHGERARSAPELAKPIEEQLEPLLIAADRWSDLGRLYDKPVDTFVERVTLHAQVLSSTEAMKATAPADMPADVLMITATASTESLREMAYKLARALKAAGRNDEAKQIADAATAVDGSSEMKAALEGRYTAPTPQQLIARAKSYRS